MTIMENKKDPKGCAVIFAGADLSCFEKSTEKEAEAVFGNCDIKLALKNHDPLGKDDIKKLALDNGFKLKSQEDGTMDLNPYVYEFAAALLKSKAPVPTLSNWRVTTDASKVVVMHKDGSGVVVEESDAASIAECILSRLALDVKSSTDEGEVSVDNALSVAVIEALVSHMLSDVSIPNFEPDGYRSGYLACIHKIHSFPESKES
jgi:hypothetical protein